MSQNIRSSKNKLYDDILKLSRWFVGANIDPVFDTRPEVINAPDFTNYFNNLTGALFEKVNGTWDNPPIANLALASGSGAVTDGKNEGAVGSSVYITKNVDNELVFRTVTSVDGSIVIDPIVDGNNQYLDFGVDNTAINIQPEQAGLGLVANIKSNYSANRPPNSSDNTNFDYTVGSRWIDITPTSQEEYVCVLSNGVDAVWKLTENLKNNFSSIIDPTTEGTAEGYAVGSRWLNTDNRVEWLLVQVVPNAIWIRSSSSLTSILNIGTNQNGNLVSTLANGVQSLKGIAGSTSITVSSTAQNVSLSVNASTLTIPKKNINPPIDRVENILNQYDHPTLKSRNPLPSDNTVEFYQVGSRWINETNDTDWVLTKLTGSVATWKETTTTGGGGISFREESHANINISGSGTTSTTGTDYTPLDLSGYIGTLGDHTNDFQIEPDGVTLKYVGTVQRKFDIKLNVWASGGVSDTCRLSLFRQFLNEAGRFRNSLLLYQFTGTSFENHMMSSSITRHTINPNDTFLWGLFGVGVSSITIQPSHIQMSISEVPQIVVQQ